jgi:translocation and assembly module TamB
MRRVVNRRRLGIGAAILLAGAAPLAVAALAQDGPDYQELDDAGQKDWLTSFVEGQLSTPERQIRLSNIDGILGSDVSVREITIADEDGVWLRVNNARLNWNQAALFVGRLEVRSLAADSIEYTRNPTPAENAPPSLPAPEAGGFEVPELPVAVQIDSLSVPQVSFGESVFGLGSAVSLEGGFSLEGGNLNANLDIVRLDGPGGALNLAAGFVNETQVLDLDLRLSEPENGILANLLNLEGRPAVDLTLAGEGPVDALVADLALDAAGRRALSGTARLDGGDAGLSISADLVGDLAPLVAAPYRPLLGAETRLSAQALLRDEGGLNVERFSLNAGQIAISGSAETTADNFLRRLELDGRIVDPAGAAVILPVPGADTTLGAAEFAIAYGVGPADAWSAGATLTELTTPDLAASSIVLSLGGIAANLDDPAARRVTVNGDGVISGVSGDPAVVAALGDELALGIAALWEAGQPINLAELRLRGAGIEALASGEIADAVFDGTIAMATSSIAPFSALAGRDLDGRLNLEAQGTISPLIGGFDLTLDGEGTGLRLDDAIADRLLEGEVAISGRLARTEAGVIADDFRLGNERITLGADGSFSSTQADFSFALDLADLALVAPQASGAVAVRGTARGADGVITLAADLSVPQGALVERDLRNGRLGFEGVLNAEGLNGAISGGATLDGQAVTLAAGVEANATRRALTDLAFTAPGARLTGDVAQGEDNLLTGRLLLDASDIAATAALALVEATGAANADIRLSGTEQGQRAEVTAGLNGVRLDDIRIGTASLALTADDLFGVPMLDGTLEGSSIAFGDIGIERLSGQASSAGEETRFALDSRLATGADISAAGNLARLPDGLRLVLERAALDQSGISARLTSPASVTMAGDVITIAPTELTVGGGRVRVGGTVADVIAIDVDINGLPLSIANAVSPGLGLAGSVDGTARVTGSASNPQVRFSASASGLDASALSGLGVAPFSASTEGSFADNTVTLARLDLRGATGLAVSGSGRVPLAGPGVDFSLEGTAPLALANRFVIDRGGQASGTANLSARVTGSLNNPQFSGTVTTAGAGYIDAETSLRLTDINTRIVLTGTEARIEAFGANLATGGSLSGSGRVGLTGQFPADISLALNQARYSDGEMVAATASGNLNVSGNLLGNPLLGGNIFIDRAEITVPEGFGAAGGVLVDVTHRAPPPQVAQTLQRARILPGGAPAPASRSPGLLLDVTLNAPNQIFVRGRGLDAEVGGSVRLTGPIENLQPVGAFELLRGRLSILGQRIDFESGSVTLVGDLDPIVNFIARTEGEGITVFVTISGRVSEIDVSFASTPALPQDEVLSRLIFNRGVGELSPLQIARLAAAAAELAGGGGGGGPLDALRSAAGLADLDVVTDAEGNVGVQAGTYIQDNVYLGVTAGAEGQSRVTINLDVTDDLTVTGAASQNGNSSIGLFYERDY